MSHPWIAVSPWRYNRDLCDPSSSLSRFWLPLSLALSESSALAGVALDILPALLGSLALAGAALALTLALLWSPALGGGHRPYHQT